MAKWTGELEVRKIYVPTGEYVEIKKGPKKGELKEKLLPVFLRKIILSHAQYGTLTFAISKLRSGAIRLSDDRELNTGVLGTSGYFNTREPQKVGGPKRSYSAAGWTNLVSNMISKEEADNLLCQL